MSTRTLATGWKIHEFEPGAGLAAGAHTAGYADEEWIGIAVPGDVHRALIDAGRIPDPFYDQNETACAWMEEREWWYRVQFLASDEVLAADARCELVCHGLDTFATIYLNGEELGEHRNMFRPAVLDVTARLNRGAQNTLAIRFDPPLRRIAGKTLSAWGRNTERTAMRKAQFGYGWDWGPRLPTIGIWRPVELREHARAALVGIQFSTLDISPAQDRAAVAVRVEADRFATAAPLTARIQLIAPDGTTAVDTALTLESLRSPSETTLAVDVPMSSSGRAERIGAGLTSSSVTTSTWSERSEASPQGASGNQGGPPPPREESSHGNERSERAAGTQREAHPNLDGVAYLSVDNPRLWWTHELGSPELYHLTVTLLDGEQTLDQHQQRVGIRTLVLDQSPDPQERGTRFFRFVLNGVPIFGRGRRLDPRRIVRRRHSVPRFSEVLMTAAERQHEHAPHLGRR